VDVPACLDPLVGLQGRASFTLTRLPIARPIVWGAVQRRFLVDSGNSLKCGALAKMTPVASHLIEATDFPLDPCQ
jgi:hypothetical protein